MFFISCNSKVVPVFTVLLTEDLLSPRPSPTTSIQQNNTANTSGLKAFLLVAL